MIPLFKGPKPQVLIDNGENWTKQLMECVNNNQPIPQSLEAKYRKPEIKAALIFEANGKCAYCESKVSHVYPGDVEHIIPKSHYPRLMFTWSNLAYACYKCNNAKRAKIIKTCKLLNPYKDDTSVHLRAFGPMVMHINASKRGELTHKELILNRPELLERRLESIKMIQNIIDKYNSETDPGIKSILLIELEEFTTSSKEFSFTNLQYLIDLGFTFS